MAQNNLEGKDHQSETELFLDELKNNLDQLKDGIIGTFEYKNRSRDGKYFVFSYNTIEGEKVDDIKQKYINQYGGNIEGLLVTDAKGKPINNTEFRGGEKIYLKVRMDNNHVPIKFVESKENAGQAQKSCIINTPGWNPASIRQIYQDEFDVVIEKDKFNITDENGNIYDENHRFEIGETIIITIKEESDLDSTDKDQENSEKNGNNYKEMIEKQAGPLTHGDRSNPEISLTFDDGYGIENVEHILDTLKSSGIHATFFILGDCIKLYPGIRKQAVKEGHQVCCHTYSHIYLSDSSDTTDLSSRLNGGINIDSWIKNVKILLGDEYYEDLKTKSGEEFPNKIKSDLLLETEILMREAQIKKTLGEDYLENLKENYPFFRFPGGCGAKRPENIAVLKKLGYLSIGRSDDFYNSKRMHMPVEYIKTMDIKNGDIPLFHFKKDDYKYIDAYIENLKEKNKSGKKVSDIIG